jgi:hypothetical protein
MSADKVAAARKVEAEMAPGNLVAAVARAAVARKAR